MRDNESYTYDIFNLYYDSAKRAKQKGDLKGARRNLLQAANALLQLAQSESGPLKAARLERAEQLIKIAENLETASDNRADDLAPQSGNARAGKNSQAQDEGKQWQSATIPDVKFDDVAGLEDVKHTIRVRMIDPIKYPEKYAAYKKKAGGGVLLYGPPGTGKTMIAKAIANEVGAKFYAVKGSDIVSKWVGESEKNINSLFETARKDDLAIIFIDEMDSLFGERGKDPHNDKRVNEFLQQIDGFIGKSPNLLLLGATNRPWDVDGAAVRSGRFSEKIYVTLPDEKARKYLFKRQLKGLPLADDVDIDKIVGMTQNYSGADIAEICDLAKEGPLKKYIETDIKQDICMADLEDAVRKVKPMVDPNEIARFEKYAGVRGARNEESPSAPRREETNRDTGSAEVIFAAETIKILPGKLQTIEFFVPGKYDRIYLQLAGRHYACENHINNWSCSVDIKTAGEYEAVVSAEREICRKKLKFVKGVEENDLDI